ncbi:organic cation/carnitine transporter 2-like isoform X2 [Antennarius striatus]|uniref:organic cation/carnitine transporter 2-like isoform X2 n=1 Tax=Antennarius striatus TaxID=241820 RepID=UPI0035ADD133
MQDFEKTVSFLRTWGPFQRRILFLLCLTAIPSGYNLLCVIFLLATPPHHCRIPAHSNLTPEWTQAIIPVQVLGQPERSSCNRYELELVQNLSEHGIRPSLETLHNMSTPSSTPASFLWSLNQEGCKDGWTYSTEHYTSTIVTEFNLVCSDQWKQPLTSLVYILGGLCGCFVSGQISDRIGRKPVLFGGTALLTIFSIAVAFAPSWPVCVALFFMLGLGQITIYVTAFVMGSELLIGWARVMFSNLCLPLFYAGSTLLLPGTAYLVTNWRHLSLVLAIPGIACIPLWWAIPESPRWLVSNGHLREAERVLRSAAVQNRVEAPDIIFPSAIVEKAPSQESDSHSFFDLLRTKKIRNITILLWLIWFCVNASYFGLSFNMSSLNGNPFLNYCLLTIIELPAYFAGWLTARCLPRRLSLIVFNLLGALALLLIQITLHSKPMVALSLVLVGRFGVLATIGVLYTITSEMSPTVIRNTMLSSCATFSRVGFSVSPYLLQLAVLSEFLPWIIVGGLSLLSVVLCLFLPETFRQPMPDTIQQLTYTARFRWPWLSTPPPKDDEKLSKNQTTTSEIICTAYL